MHRQHGAALVLHVSSSLVKKIPRFLSFYHGILHRLFFFILVHEIESDDDYIDYDVDEDDTFDISEMTCRGRAVYWNANLMMGGQEGK